MTDIKLNINIVGNPRGVAVLETNRELSVLSAFDGGGTAMNAQNGLFPTSANDGKKCFVVGVTALGDTEYTLTAERGYTGYITRDLANVSGDLPSVGGSTAWTLRTGGVGVLFIRFEFDQAAQQYPTAVKVFDENGGEVTEGVSSGDNFFAYEGSVPIYTIEFAKWAHPNYPACITNIETVPSDFEFPKRNIAAITATTESQNEASNIEYGVIASTGNVTLLDTYSAAYGDYLLREYARQGWINKNATELQVTLNGATLRTAIVQSQSTYDEAQKQLSIPITDKLNSFSELQVPDISLQTANGGGTNPISLLTLLTHLLTKYGGLGAAEYDLSRQIVVGGGGEKTVSDYLGAIFVPVGGGATLKADTLANDIAKVCAVAQLNCYCGADGVVVFDSARPLVTQTAKDNCLEIPTNLQLSAFSFSIITNNNFSKVAFSDEEVEGVTNADNLFTVQSNELFEAGAYVDTDTNLAREVVRNNILADYKGGVYSGAIEIMLGADIRGKGQRVLRFADGEIPKPDDVVAIYKDITKHAYVTDRSGNAILWKITSATFDWSGNPTMRLQVMQILN